MKNVKFRGKDEIRGKKPGISTSSWSACSFPRQVLSELSVPVDYKRNLYGEVIPEGSSKIGSTPLLLVSGGTFVDSYVCSITVEAPECFSKDEGGIPVGCFSTIQGSCTTRSNGSVTTSLRI